MDERTSAPEADGALVVLARFVRELRDASPNEGEGKACRRSIS
jgi:hypothetical protein